MWPSSNNFEFSLVRKCRHIEHILSLFIPLPCSKKDLRQFEPHLIYLSAINTVVSQYVLLFLGLTHPVPLKRTLQNKRNRNIRGKKRKKKRRVSRKRGNITKRKKRREKRKSILLYLIVLKSPKSNWDFGLSYQIFKLVLKII